MDVVFDGASYWLVDGFHRRWGADKAGLDGVKCNVRNGTLDDARWLSYAANQSHGMRRKNEDKKKAVVAALKHPRGEKLSDSQIAEHCGVGQPMVSRHRKELEATQSINKSDVRTGRDGRTTNTANIGKSSGSGNGKAKAKNGKPAAPAENRETPRDASARQTSAPAAASMTSQLADHRESFVEPEGDGGDGDDPSTEATPLDHLKHWWSMATAGEKKKFLKWVEPS